MCRNIFLKLAALSLVYCFSVAAQTELVDPTRPLGHSGTGANGVNAKAVDQAGPQLSSIIYSEGRRVAIINGHALSENQKLEGAGLLVKKIEKEQVLVFVNNRLVTLKLAVQDVKKANYKRQAESSGESSPL